MLGAERADDIVRDYPGRLPALSIVIALELAQLMRERTLARRLFYSSAPTLLGSRLHSHHEMWATTASRVNWAVIACTAIL
jgi:hypothetical protein